MPQRRTLIDEPYGVFNTLTPLKKRIGIWASVGNFFSNLYVMFGRLSRFSRDPIYLPGNVSARAESARRHTPHY